MSERCPCPDDLCVGVLDAHGVCGICGRTAEPPPLSRAEEVWEDDGGTEPEGDSDVAEASGDHGAGDAGDDERRPCPDDLCTGVLDADGVCGTCGRRAATP